MVLNIELYKKGDLHCAYIADYSFSEDTDEELEDED